MNRNLCVLVLAASAALTGASTFAGEIYKYVDENGNVNFVDRPTGQSGEERLDITYARTSNAAISAQIERRQEYTAARDKAREDALSQREAEEQLRAEADQRDAKCQEHRARLESYLHARRLYRENDVGEREYLSDSEMLEARRKLEERIAESCS